ncbi:MAG TPA: TA system VapC family ribonuclease toxin [Solirubrobacteraceae bacterium]|jgi:toxin-antitoxin system PIN domain toxin|nr:TA system VapC family ribonuclease toxin [Solirubrobacteraceae bacterium]
MDRAHQASREGSPAAYSAKPANSGSEPAPARISASHAATIRRRSRTRSVVLESPLGVDAAIELVESWLDQPCVTVIDPTERHAAVLRELLLPLGTAGNLTTDAHLAALAIEHGALLCSCDTDFSRFPGLRWLDPLQTG